MPYMQLAELIIGNDLEEILAKHHHLELIDIFYEFNIYTAKDLASNEEYFYLVRSVMIINNSKID